MQNEHRPDFTSHNTIGELTGSAIPSETVLVSGHIDSWDVGQGAMDDAGGSFLALNVLLLLKQMDLRPKRTLRSVMWTGEEQGCYGAAAYFNNHKDEVPTMDLVIESDAGTFNPTGLIFSGNAEAQCILQEISNLMSPINATGLEFSSGAGPDVGNWIRAGVPGMSLLNDNERYFWFHHSEGDTMTVENPDELDRSTALWAAAIYIIADLDNMLPRDLVKN